MDRLPRRAVGQIPVDPDWAARALGDRRMAADLSQFATLIAQAVQMPIVLVSTFVGPTQHVLASHGLAVEAPLPCDETLCATVAASAQPLVIPDTLLDPGWSDSRYVTGEPHLRAYLGVPMVGGDGELLGTVCAIDTQPRDDLDAGRVQTLSTAAAMLAAQLRRRAQRMAAQAERALFVAGPMACVVWRASAGWPLAYQSGNLADLVGDAHAQRLAAGAGWDTIALEADRELLRSALASHLQTGLTDMEISFRAVLPSGELRWLRQASWADRDDQGTIVRLRGYLIDDTRLRRVESGLASTQERLSLALESASMGTWDMNLDTRERLLSPRVAEMIGLRPEEMDTHLDYWRDRIHPLDRSLVQDGLRRHAEDVRHADVRLEYRVRHQQGHYIWVQSCGRVVARDKTGAPRRLVGTLLDVTEQKHNEMARQRKRQLLALLHRVQATFMVNHDLREACQDLLRQLLEMTGSTMGFIGVMQTDAQGRPQLVLPAVTNIAWNDATRQLYDAHAHQGQDLVFDRFDNLFGHVITSGDIVCTNAPEHHAVARGTPPGHPALDNFLGLPIRFGDEVTGMIGLANSQSDYEPELGQLLQPLVTTLGSLFHARALDQARRLAEQRLREQATRDALTGLSNRRHFLEEAERSLQRARRDGTPLALALIDLDYFKRVNDEHGHAAGDEVLRQFAVVAQEQMREIDLLGRVGGEEFALILHNASAEGALAAVDRLRQRWAATPVDVGHARLSVTLSAGLVDWSGPEMSLTAWLAEADRRLYAAKAAGRDQVCAGAQRIEGSAA